MSTPGFIVRNAMRNKRRLTLTLCSVALSLFLLTVLQVVLRGRQRMSGKLEQI